MIQMPIIMLAPLWGLLLFYFFPLPSALAGYIVLLVTGVYFNGIMFWAMRLKHQTGIEALIGREALVIKDIVHEGQVQIRGEIWRAVSSDKKIPAGKNVKIVETKGLTLIVKPLERK